MSKPKTKEQSARATDQRRKKKYGVGTDWYEQKLEEQNGGCAICGSTPKTRDLHIDHDHSYKKVKIETTKLHTGQYPWMASTLYLGKSFTAQERTKSEAIREVRKKLKTASVRGLLCFPHNTALRHFSDNPELLRAGADYLEQHQKGNGK